MSIRLRARPKKPVRKKKELKSFHIYDGTTLSELIRELPDGIEPKDVALQDHPNTDDLT
jgi:hypothetical protein